MTRETSRAHEWKDGEVGYCMALVRTRGDRNCPFESVASYLSLQFDCAVRDARDPTRGATVAASDAANELAVLRREWAGVAS